MTDDPDRLRNVWSDLQSLRGRFSNCSNSISREMNRIQARLAEIEGYPRDVTDHAVLRYLERIDGIDMDTIRSKIRSLCDAAEVFAHCDGLWHASGLVLITNEEGAIVTILDAEQAKKYAGRRLVNGDRAAPVIADWGTK